MSTSVRPVACCFPASTDIWEDTNLPLGLVITPFSSVKSAGDNESENHGRADNNSSTGIPSPLLKDIPKCLHCGAPHPASASHYPLPRELLCYLCAKVSSTRFGDQQVARHEEHLEVYCYSPSPRKPTKSNNEICSSIFTITPPVPAMSCPPLYWIILDGTCSSRLYWTVAAKTLASVMESAPDHLHLGLLMATSSTLSVFDLTSPSCHVQHHPSSTAASTTHSATAKTVKTVLLQPVPMLKCHIQPALRAIADMGTVLCDSTAGIALSMPIQCILHTLQQQPQYAGGTVLCLLSDSNKSMTSRPFGRGGLGGACAQEGLRFTTKHQQEESDPTTTSTAPKTTGIDLESGSIMINQPTTTTEISNDDESDLTPQHLHDVFPQCGSGAPNMWNDLGIKCAQASLGVDVVVLADSNVAQAALPILFPLSRRSGVPGPLLFDITNDTTLLERHILSRTPWYKPMAFGGMLRLRLSPGLELDDTDEVPDTTNFPQLAPLHIQKGLYGAASPTPSKGLWHIGACDEESTMCVDLKIKAHRVQRLAHVHGMGDVAIRPICQICFEFTTVVQDKDGNYVTIRVMRITTVPLPMVSTPEQIYATLDPEALMVMLVHKLANSLFTQGLEATQDIATKWLQAFLVCAYQSAEAYEVIQKENEELGISNDCNQCYINERLLHRDGSSSLTDEEILLCQGHELLKKVPLMIWALLQCDAFRPSFGSFRPSVDARCAALLQLSSMSPVVLAKRILPRLELWDDTEAISELDLSLEHIKMHILEYQQQSKEPLLLFLDSPSVLLVYDSRRVVPTANIVTENAAVGSNLEQAIDMAANCYRLSPPIVYEVGEESSSDQVLKDFLVEDSVCSSKKDFVTWKREMAVMVQEEVLNATK